MTGLDTIVEQILQEAQKEAEEIKAQAARNADSIIANAKKTVDKMNEETGSPHRNSRRDRRYLRQNRSSSEICWIRHMTQWWRFRMRSISG